MLTQKENNPLEIFAGNIVEASMVKNLLENEGINAYLKDELMGTLNPWYVTAAGVGAVKVLISAFDFEKARPVIEAYQNNTTDK
jgi:hypothetical protein